MSKNIVIFSDGTGQAILHFVDNKEYTLNFYDSFGNYTAVESVGDFPASKYVPKSSFILNTHQLLSVFDGGSNQEIVFNPFIYNIEGGRRDWLNSGLGNPEKSLDAGNSSRSYGLVSNANKTIIDFNHPFNASGRINKIYAALTLDNKTFDNENLTLENAEILFFRPLEDGSLKVLDKTVSIKNRDKTPISLYSETQEYVELDCDIFVNKGDLIGVFNANIYRGEVASGGEIGALFYQIPGKAAGTLAIDVPLGEGGTGLLIYARSCQIQSKLIIDIDLSERLNIDSVEVIGTTVNEILEYNVARCLDINWNVDLFGGDHTTTYATSLTRYYYNHPNVFYGKECLTDGINIVSDGLGGTSFDTNMSSTHSTYEQALHKKDGGSGVIVYGPKYFHVNGDNEWITLLNVQALDDFRFDPVEFTLIFSGAKKKVDSILKVGSFENNSPNTNFIRVSIPSSPLNIRAL